MSEFVFFSSHELIVQLHFQQKYNHFRKEAFERKKKKKVRLWINKAPFSVLGGKKALLIPEKASLLK